MLLFHRFLPNDKSHTIYARHEHGPGISFLTSGHLIETLNSFLGNSSGIPALDQLGRQFVLDSIEGVNSRDSIRNKMEMRKFRALDLNEIFSQASHRHAR